MRFALPALVLISACSPNEGSVPFGTADDTGQPDEDDTGGGGGGDDTGQPAPTGQLRFVVDSPRDGLAVDLHQYDLEDGSVIGRNGSTAFVGEVAAFDPEPPDDADLTWLADDGYPDTGIAVFHTGLWLDEDGDGEVNGDEVYSGVGASKPLYLTGPVPEFLASMGLEEGWNVVFFAEESLTVDDPQDISVSENMLPNELLDIGGDVDVDTDGTGLALVSVALLGGEAWVEPLYNEAPFSGSSWSMSLDGSPGEDHIVDWDGGGFAYAFELPLLYADRDLSGDISNGDDISAQACVDGSTAGVIWFPPTDDIEITAALHTFGVPLGWNAVMTGEDDGLSVLSDTEASSMHFDGSCSLE